MQGWVLRGRGFGGGRAGRDLRIRIGRGLGSRTRGGLLWCVSGDCDLKRSLKEGCRRRRDWKKVGKEAYHDLATRWLVAKGKRLHRCSKKLRVCFFLQR
jgi:hypothetical protein